MVSDVVIRVRGASLRVGGVGSADGGQGMVGGEGVFEDRQCLAIEVGGLVGAVLLGDGHSEVVELAGGLGMVRAEDRSSDGQALSQEPFGVGRVAAGDRAGGEVAEVDGDFVLVGWVPASEDGQGPLEELLGLVNMALVEQGCAEHGEVLRDEVVVRSELSHGAVQRVAAQLGYGIESVRSWVKQADIDGGVKVGVTTAEAERVKRLEQENRELRRASEILRRASIFFAAELDRSQR